MVLFNRHIRKNAAQKSTHRINTTSDIFKKNLQRPLAADVASFAFLAVYKAADTAPEKIPAGHNATDATVFEFFAACEAADNSASLTQFGSHTKHMHF